MRTLDRHFHPIHLPSKPTTKRKMHHSVPLPQRTLGKADTCLKRFESNRTQFTNLKFWSVFCIFLPKHQNENLAKAKMKFILRRHKLETFLRSLQNVILYKFRRWFINLKSHGIDHVVWKCGFKIPNFKCRNLIKQGGQIRDGS